MGGGVSKEADGSITFANYVSAAGLGNSIMFLWLLPTFMLTAYGIMRLGGLSIAMSRQNSWILLGTLLLLSAIHFIYRYFRDNEQSIKGHQMTRARQQQMQPNHGS